MNIKDKNFENYLKFHNTLPNPSTEILHVQYNDSKQNQSPEELVILPPFEKFMENMKATQDTVR